MYKSWHNQKMIRLSPVSVWYKGAPEGQQPHLSYFACCMQLIVFTIHKA